MKIFFPIFFCLYFASCDNKVNTSKTYVSNDCNIEFKNLSFEKIINSTTDYDNQPVEITGYFHGAFEMCAISARKNINKTKSLILVDFSNQLIDSLHPESQDKFVLEKINKKKIKIRGYMDANSHGHLGGYNCTIKEICYLEIFE